MGMAAKAFAEVNVIDHVSIAVRDLKLSAAFYDAVLGALGLQRLAERSAMIGYGRKYPEFWLNARPAMAVLPEDCGAHLCLRAPTADAVRAFHSLALAGGGFCNGPPGDRQAAMTVYFAAFIRDRDGNRLEAAHFPKPA